MRIKWNNTCRAPEYLMQSGSSRVVTGFLTLPFHNLFLPLVGKFYKEIFALTSSDLLVPWLISYICEKVSYSERKVYKKVGL